MLNAVLSDPSGLNGNDEDDYEAIEFGIDQYYLDRQNNFGGIW